MKRLCLALIGLLLFGCTSGTDDGPIDAMVPDSGPEPEPK